MKLRQLQLLCQVVDCNLNVSEAARVMHTTQPNVSRQLQALEQELTIGIFVRSKKKLMALTDAGAEAVQSARRAIREIESIGQIGKTGSLLQTGSLTIAASHAQARYTLPEVVREFMKKHPKVRLVLLQGGPEQIMSWVIQGQADIAITSETNKLIPDLALFPCHKHSRILLVPRGHPLKRISKPTLEQLAKYPLITYNASFSVYRRVEEAFSRKRIVPNIVLSATDADVMKTYVRLGLGVAVVASLAFSAREDKDLQAIDANHLFEQNLINIGLRKSTYLKPYVYDFIEIFSPLLRREQIQRTLFNE
ncbi:MAG: LysR substrate-binding domain-containing protein [Burkholderiales bacterium]|nr:LysR substrate-binding domain-containing protein [Burkholderiales bacterium]